MAVYYNRSKKTFIESDLSEDMLKKNGYGSVYVIQLKVGKGKKNIWILKGDYEIIAEIGVGHSDNYCEIVNERKVESLDEIRAYFAYLKRFILLSRPGRSWYDEKLENENVRIEHNHFADDIAFYQLIPLISYIDFLNSSDTWEKNNFLELRIPLYNCVSKIHGGYDYEYLYYPFISILASLLVCKNYSFLNGERSRDYNWIIERLPNIINYKYSFYDVKGLELDDIDFDDLYSSVIAFKGAKKNFEMLLSKNAKEIEELKKRIVMDASKEFQKEIKLNEETRKKYADDIELLLQKMNELSGDSRFNSLKEEFFKEIGLVSQKSFLEFKKMLENTISDLDDKRNEIMLLNNQLSKLVSRTRKQIEEDIKKIIQSGNESIDTIKNTFNELEKKRGQLIKDITEEVVREVIKRNPVQEINISLGDEDIRRKTKGIYHEAFKKILQLVYLRTPVFLVGPAGCGKNVMLKQAAKVLDLQFYYINDAREKYDLLGFVDANGKYQETQFYKAFTNGGLLMIDELDSADASVLLLLNSALGTGDDFYMTFPDGNQYQAHPDFHLVAAANTFGTGANQTYNGRNQLDGASLNRFVAVLVDYDTNIERTLVNNPDILPLYWEVRRIIRENEINYVVSTRNILNADKYFSSKVFSNDDIFAWTLVGSMTEFDLGVIISNIKTTDKYSTLFIDYVKRNYEIKEANEKTKTKARTRNDGYDRYDEDYSYDSGRGRYGGYGY